MNKTPALRLFIVAVITSFFLTSCLQVTVPEINTPKIDAPKSDSNAPTNGVPNKTTSFSATHKSNNLIELSWASVSGATHYEIYRGHQSDGSDRKKLFSQSATNYTDDVSSVIHSDYYSRRHYRIHSGSNSSYVSSYKYSYTNYYYYWIKSCNFKGCSEFSDRANP